MKRKKRNEWEKNSLIVYVIVNFETFFRVSFFSFLKFGSTTVSIDCLSAHLILRQLWLRMTFLYSSMNSILFFVFFLYVLACMWTLEFNHYQFLSYAFVRIMTRTSYIDIHLISFVASYVNKYIYKEIFLLLYFLFSNYIIWHKNIVSQSFPPLVYWMDAGQNSC
jgi:hypothetical protein